MDICPKKVIKKFEVNWNVAYIKEQNLKYYKKLREFITSIFAGKQYIYLPTPFSFNYLKTYSNQHKNTKNIPSLIIDIGYEVTKFAIIKNNRCIFADKLNIGTNNIAHDIFSIVEIQRTSEPLFQSTFQDFQALIKDKDFSIFPERKKLNQKISQQTNLNFNDINEIAYLRINELFKKIREKTNQFKIQRLNIAFICSILKFEELKKMSESVLGNRNEVVKLKQINSQEEKFAIIFAMEKYLKNHIEYESLIESPLSYFIKTIIKKTKSFLNFFK